MKWNSRPSLGGRRRFHAAAPRGNRAGVGEQQFAVEPSLGALVGVLGVVPELRERLEALEDQLDLPACPVHSSTASAGKVVNRTTYLASSSVRGCKRLPRFDAWRRKARCAMRMASAILPFLDAFLDRESERNTSSLVSRKRKAGLFQGAPP